MPNPDPTQQAQQVKDMFRQTVLNVAAQAFQPCQTEDCPKRSPGTVCHLCSRRVCATHGFLTLSAPPQVICATCIVTDASTPKVKPSR